MKRYLIDVNLPFHFTHWHGEEFVHQREIDPRMHDKNIWEYAKTNNLTIVTKDTDFADRIIIQTPPPKVIHIKIGNMKLKLFHDFISKHWGNIAVLSESYKLVNVYQERLEGID